MAAAEVSQGHVPSSTVHPDIMKVIVHSDELSDQQPSVMLSAGCKLFRGEVTHRSTLGKEGVALIKQRWTGFVGFVQATWGSWASWVPNDLYETSWNLRVG